MPRAAKTVAAVETASAAPPKNNYPVLRDPAVVAAAEEYHTLNAEADRIEARRKFLKERVLLPAMGGAPTAYAGSRILVANDVPALPPTDNVTITRDMIGQVVPGKKGRAGYTQLRTQ